MSKPQTYCLIILGIAFTVVVALYSESKVEGKPSLLVKSPKLSSCEQGMPANFVTVNIKDDHPAISIFDGNKDGKQDILIVNHASSTVSLLLSSSNNDYSSLQSFSCGKGTLDIVTADFNNDGNIDFATVNQLSSDISIYTGNGDGIFNHKKDLIVHGTPRAIKAGKFNGDGSIDLIIATIAEDGDFAIVLLGDGVGDFSEVEREVVSDGPEDIAIGDFNNDGKQDAIVVETSRSTIRVLLGDGAGKLQSLKRFSTAYFPNNIEVGDLNADGRLDFAVIDNENQFTIFYGNGGGDFPIQTTVSTPSLATDITFADYNNDGRLDIIALMVRPSKVGIFLASQTYQFSMASEFTIPIANPNSIGIKDLTGDISKDFVITGSSKKDFSLTDNEAISIIGLSPACAFANLSLELLTSPTPVVSGQPINLSFKVTNTGPDLATFSTFTFALPQGASLVSATSTQGTCSGSSLVTCRLGDIAAQQSASTLKTVSQASTVTVSIQIKPNCDFTGTLNYSANVQSNPPDPNPQNNTVTGSVNVSRGIPTIAIQGQPSNTTTITGMVAKPLSVMFTASGGIAPYAFTSSNLPNWLTLASNGTLTGTPPQSGKSNFTVNVQGQNGCIGSLALVVDVNDVVLGPGSNLPPASEVSSSKAGSILFYNVYTSSVNTSSQNTRISITNVEPQRKAYVHLFFVDGSSCSVADSIICLTANQTASFLASDLDPGTTGYLVAVAIDQNGCPTNFNYLIGDEFVKFSSGHSANLAAEAIAAIPGGLPVCTLTASISELRFDGLSYNGLPRTLGLSNIASRADGNDTMLILNRVGGNLGTGAATIADVFGVLYDDAEKPLSFSFSPRTCQFRSSISNNFPRTTPRFEQSIPAGRTGWMRLYAQSDQALLGAALNYNVNVGNQSGAFNQGHNLHKLTLTKTASFTIPVFPPSC